MEFNHHPSHGFRFSITDGVVILVCTVATWLLHPVLKEIVWLFPFVLGHFFLFCNVFRIHRNLELIWAGIFLLNFTGCSVLDFGWNIVLAIQIPITILLIAMEIRSSRYHGIFSVAHESANEMRT